MQSTVRKLAARAAVAAAIAATAPVALAISFSNVYSFGDSLSDTGNIAQVTGFPMPPYTPGRFTSDFQDGTAGQVWVEYVSAHFGGASVNSLAGGTNYAWGGARTGPDNAGLPPSLLDQHNFFLNDMGGVADPDALYTVFGGGNDVRDNDIASSVGNIRTIIENLAAAGARNFFVPNLPDIGMTPESLGGGAPGGSAATISAASVQFNTDLSAMLDDLEATLDITIARLDLFATFNSVIADPTAFGLTNASDSCFTGDLDGSGGTLCSDVDSFLFFDGIHPTAAGHALVGGLAIDAIEAAFVPIPAALPMRLAAVG
ncbi:MAG: SGNH/GDSL hydrolase family protein, partial [Pseudomonadota bacterium]